MANAGTVTINLDAESVKLIRELQKATRKTQGAATKMRRSMSTAFKQIKRAAGGLALALGATFSAQMIRNQLAYAGNLQRVAETVAFTAEQVQELRFAAGQLNLEQRTLDMALQRFSRRMGEAAMNTGEALKTVKQYGITIKDSGGNVRDNIDILRDWAEVIANVDDEQERLRIAFKLFDSEGAPLVRLLAQGAQGMDMFAEKARELGVVISDELINDAAETDRVFNQIKATIDSKMAAQVASNAAELERMAEAIGTVAAAAIDGIVGVTSFFAAIGTGIDGLNAFTDRVLGEEQGDAITAAFDAYKEAADKLETLKKFGRDQGVDVHLDQQQAVVDALHDKWVRLREVATETHHAFVEANVEAARVAATAAEETVAAVQEAGELLDELTIEGKLDRILRPEIQEDVEELTRSTSEWFAELVKAKEATDEISDAGKEMGFIFASAFEDAIIEGEKLGDVFKALLKDIARMILRMNVTQPIANAIGSAFGGAKAAGGSVLGSRSYLVGEEGPELFTPGGSGFITPNNALAGAGGHSVSYTIDARGVDEERIMQRMAPLLEQTVEVTRTLVKRDQLEGSF